MSCFYHIHKGINQPIEFRGLKAQYIWWLGGGLALLVLLFAFLYIVGVSLFVCVLLIFGLGAGLFSFVYRMSKQYGEYGMMKKVARKYVPNELKGYSSVKFRESL